MSIITETSWWLPFNTDMSLVGLCIGGKSRRSWYSVACSGACQ